VLSIVSLWRRDRGLRAACDARVEFACFADHREGYIEIFQGTPLLMQLFLVFFGLPLLGIEVQPWIAATVGSRCSRALTSRDLAWLC